METIVICLLSAGESRDDGTFRTLRAVLTIALASALVACGTSKEFLVESAPSGALVIEHDQETIDTSTQVKYHGETPVKAKLHFHDASTTKSITLEKRGYGASRLVLDQTANPKVSVSLKPLPFDRPEALPVESIRALPLTLLPVSIDVMVQRLNGEAIEESDAVVAARLSEAVTEAVARAVPGVRVNLKDESPSNAFPMVAREIRQVLFMHAPERIRYYGKPLRLDAVINDYASAIRQLKASSDGDAPRYYLYVSAFAKSESHAVTGQRVARDVLGFLAEVMLGVLQERVKVSMAKSGGDPRRTYWPDTRVWSKDPLFLYDWVGTIGFVAVIDSTTSEVIYYNRHILSDVDIVASPRDLESFAQALMAFWKLESMTGTAARSVGEYETYEREKAQAGKESADARVSVHKGEADQRLDATASSATTGAETSPTNSEASFVTKTVSSLKSWFKEMLSSSAVEK